jgi:hypothetical protein
MRGYQRKGATNVTYLVICQNDKVFTSCVTQTDLRILEGPMFVGEVNNSGTIVKLFRGTIIGGQFHPMQGEASVTGT